MQFFVNCPPWSPTPAPSTCPFSTCPFCLLVFFDNCIELGMDKWTKSSFVYWSLPERLWNTENRSPFSSIAEKLGANEIEHLSKNNYCIVLKFNRRIFSTGIEVKVWFAWKKLNRRKMEAGICSSLSWETNSIMENGKNSAAWIGITQTVLNSSCGN